MPFIAFLLIGLDLSSRDYLHEAWDGNYLVWKMLALIGCGSVLTYIVNQEAERIALASFLAFASAGASDAVIYAILKGRVRLLKVNGSNLVSALVDSIVFPAVAFGLFSAPVIAAQYAAKVGGGFFWSMILERYMWGRKVASPALKQG
ncbi:MAG: VUT family protein [Deltaproteobacteria bacterium]|nr:VUT family protein [Deltaproteobacteria bacterium]